MQAQDQRRTLIGRSLVTLHRMGWAVLFLGNLCLTLSADESLPSEANRRMRSEQLVQRALESGDSSRGLALFTNTKAACFSCHKIGEAGSGIGPALTDIGKGRPAWEIAESLLWPNAKIDPAYLPYKVLLDDDSVATGYLAPEQTTATILALKDPALGSVREIPRDEIVAQTKSLSLMPNGLVDSLPEDKQSDLLRFLLELGTSPKVDIRAIESAIKNANHHEPTTFEYARDPLHPEWHPQWQAFVNRSRIYDYYSKQAAYFRNQPTHVDLLETFPGLDGKEFGHWGNQNEDYWKGEAWAKAAPNLIQCNVLIHPKKTISRAICFRLGERLDWAACYNSDTCSYEFMWKGAFLQFSNVRHGFIDGVRIAGEEQPLPERMNGPAEWLGLPPQTEVKFCGYYVRNNEVLFDVAVNGEHYIDRLQFSNGQWTRTLTLKKEMEKGLQGGATKWPDTIETDILIGEGKGLVVDTIRLPFPNPWNVELSCGGHAFLSDGTAIVATMQGDVFRVEGVTNRKAKWRRIAAGLHHALGVCVHEDEIYVLGRNQISRLHDLNGDFEIDRYECFSNAFQTSPSGHDYICGLERDATGHFYIASGNQGIVQISPDGQTAKVIANGFRNPDGLGLLPDGTLTVPSSEGDWTPTSMVSLVRPVNAGQPVYRQDPVPFYGYRGPKEGQTLELPLLYLPRGVDNSSGGQHWIDDPRMGPLHQQLVHSSFGAGTALVLLKDQVGERTQGASYVLPGSYLSGIHRARTNPKDGQLYFTGMNGWGTYTTDAGCFQRLRYTGDPLCLPVGFHVHENGVEVQFSDRLAPSIASQVNRHFAQCWNYRYTPGYGSKEYSVFHSSMIGHDRLNIASAHVSEDGRSLFLEIPELQLCNQLHLQIAIADNETVDLYATIHAMDAPRQVPNAVALQGIVRFPHPILRDLEWLQKSVPNPWRNRIDKARNLRIEARDNLQYSTRNLEARPGELVKLTFANPDVVPHNWALIKPGTLEKIGGLANRLVNDPEAYLNHYVPKSDDVICYTDVVEPKGEFSIYFQVPTTPGRYPYLCTFPGHWMVMNGELIVK